MQAANFDTVLQKFGGGSALMSLPDRMADVLLVATALAGESPDTVTRLEQRGLAAAWSGLRFAYSVGGDGESDMRLDLRNFAAFVRDPAALVTCLLLPYSCSMRLEMQVLGSALQYIVNDMCTCIADLISYCPTGTLKQGLAL